MSFGFVGHMTLQWPLTSPNCPALPLQSGSDHGSDVAVWVLIDAYSCGQVLGSDLLTPSCEIPV